MTNDPYELMKLAENEPDREERHPLADDALLERMKQLDPEFAERYEKVREKGFWYA